ncbi:hypothetical protein [Tortoise microvirus 78]|nr:hypothetical protein [Tortoise microvirus 78]
MGAGELEGTEMTPQEIKKRDAGDKLAFDTHVGILMRVQGLSKPVAQARAYSAGPGGLNSLLAPANPPKG